MHNNAGPLDLNSGISVRWPARVNHKRTAEMALMQLKYLRHNNY